MMNHRFGTLLIALVFAGLNYSVAQTFTVPSDTVYATIVTSSIVHDDITNITTAPMKLRWQVVATSFPADWLRPGAFSMCDNRTCIPNSGDTLLWRTATGLPGATFLSDYYLPTSPGLFDLTLDLTTATTIGTYWLTAAITDPGSSYTRNVTFVINNLPLRVAAASKGEIGAAMYPNPAKNEVHVECKNAKTIVLFNGSGNVINVQTADKTGTILDIQNLAQGYYFVKILDSNGGVLMFGKFEKE